jgi:hypothetical protein
MFKITFDDGEIQDLIVELGKLDLDPEKHIKWYINQVYADLAKKHGRAFSYQTPPNSNRTVLRKRSGELLQELKDSKFVDVDSEGNWEAGFNIEQGSILSVHEGSEDDSPTIISAKSGEYMTIPLKAALGSNGVLTDRTYAQMRKFLIVDTVTKQAGKSGSKIIPITHSQLLANGENVSKLQNTLILGKWSGRKVVPYFILARHVSIPKRLFIFEAMSDRLDDLYDRLTKAVGDL